MKRVVSEPQGRLLRGLTRLIEAQVGTHPRQFPPMIVESFESWDWASLTFSGHRHRLGIVVPGTRQRPVLDGLDIAGAIVADVRVVKSMASQTDIRLTIEVLTIDEKR